jgi:hypothetical protein
MKNKHKTNTWNLHYTHKNLRTHAHTHTHTYTHTHTTYTHISCIIRLSLLDTSSYYHIPLSSCDDCCDACLERNVCFVHLYNVHKLSFKLLLLDLNACREFLLLKTNKELCIVLYCIVLCCVVLCCVVLCCVVLCCIVLYCIVLYCIVLPNNIVFVITILLFS